jgi:hypothetical protein
MILRGLSSAVDGTGLLQYGEQEYQARPPHCGLWGGHHLTLEDYSVHSLICQLQCNFSAQIDIET